LRSSHSVNATNSGIRSIRSERPTGSSLLWPLVRHLSRTLNDLAQELGRDLRARIENAAIETNPGVSTVRAKMQRHPSRQEAADDEGVGDTEI
jgi:hypothetical protein